MFKRFSLGWCKTPLLMFLLPGFIVTGNLSAQAETDKVPQDIMQIPPVTFFQSSIPVSDLDGDATQPNLQVDPLDSPYPVPWNWLMTAQSEFNETGSSGLRYYRTPSLISPDGQYAVYSRIQMEVESELFRSRVTSVVFLENLHTGELQVIRAASPLAQRLLEAEAEDIPRGSLSILIPVSWSEKGDRLLCRQLEGFLSTSDASDYAVIWDRQTHRAITISPEQVDYTNAVLLGWSSLNPDQVLFRAGILGDEDWPLWAVALDGRTVASQTTPIIYGHLVTHTWTGSQVLK